ncbi:Wadjet anti-phage system protein JetD domain-containing protein [Candidatus Mycobacterium methanotrophicum]|uniref:DUF2220 family protein n=1 Tax=Candidatus Mycobacterium methanotrophicum TaxID=2943498 RepID=A0ABY4QMT1_9MYCO|nr:Wadjet anti-phage system protein JetD domain-containing protein [Candidatus Mycobacterium methanotrophicum]UQX11618.1 DUF2220 family protein [Candidatus Mycobacterium methanotrophicum]
MTREWSTPQSIRARLRRRWDTGAALTARARGDAFAPIDLPIRGPTASELGARYAEVVDWARQWAPPSPDYTVTTKVLGSRRVGANEIPDRIRIDSYDGLVGFLGTTAQARRHLQLAALAKDLAPQIYSWVVEKPMRALAHGAEFDRLLACVGWLVDNSDRDRYLRQIDVPGVDTKFVEHHHAILSELADLVIDEPADGRARDFAVRYGFRGKPSRVRIRILDPTASVLPAGVSDIELRVDETRPGLFDVDRVFLVENEVTCLAFPAVPRSLLIFGGGYAVSRVAQLDWLRGVPLYYWGDIDTHGFRILNGLRSSFPEVRSMLMDRGTLIAHEQHWDREPAPVNTHLPHLRPDEAALYRDLVEEVLGPAVRLEQERISYPVAESTARALS